MSWSRFNRERFAPSSNDPWARSVQQDAGAPAGSYGSFFDEPTVEFDASALSSMLARSTNEAQEETRTYQIPAEVLALARGDRTASGSGSAARARLGSLRVAPLAHVLVIAWAIALGYFLVQLIDG
jgi:hypothetical protein